MTKIQTGTILNDRFEVLELIGEGGSATVYRAHDNLLKRDLALKVLKESFDNEAILRFQREARIVAGFNHKNILAVYSYGTTENNCVFIAMELLDGRNLRSLLNSEKALNSIETKSILMQISDGLAYAHEAGVIHRDISCANIFLSKIYESKLGFTAKILDFGLSRTSSTPIAPPESEMTATGTLIGNPQYMSPEACRGEKVDFRSDIYSLGCVLYECMTGSTLFPNESGIGLLHLHQSNYPKEPLLSWADKNEERLMKDILLCCLQKNPKNRFSNAREIMESLSTGRLTIDKSISLESWSNASEKEERSNRRLYYHASFVVLLFFVVCLFNFESVFNKKPSSLLNQQEDRSITTDSLLIRSANNALNHNKYDEAIECWRTVLDKKQSRTKSDLANLALSASILARESHRKTNDSLKKKSYLLACLEFSDKGLPAASLIKDKYPLLELCRLRLEALEGLNKSDDLKSFIKTMLKTGESLDDISRISLGTLCGSALARTELPNDAELLLRKNLEFAETRIPKQSEHGNRLQAQWELATVLIREKERKAEGLSIAKQVFEDLMENKLLNLRWRYNILEDICSDYPDSKALVELLEHELEEHATLYSKSPWDKARIVQMQVLLLLGQGNKPRAERLLAELIPLLQADKFPGEEYTRPDFLKKLILLCEELKLKSGTRKFQKMLDDLSGRK